MEGVIVCLEPYRGGVSLVCHHGRMLLLVKNVLTAATAPLSVSGLGCGR
jgi:hypothetical protein